jgi:hypothetical protein
VGGPTPSPTPPRAAVPWVGAVGAPPGAPTHTGPGPGAGGPATRIRKRTSHITIVVSDMNEEVS